MANTWLVPVFDYTLQKYTGVYWNLASINYFVDSKNGSDSYAGTKDAPFKTLSKAYGLASAGQIIMINGYFDEILSWGKAIQVIGAGGGIGGKSIIVAGRISITVTNTKWDDILFEPYGDLTAGVYSYTIYCSGCIFNSNYYVGASFYCYYTLYFASTFRGSGYDAIRGNNNTLYNCGISGSLGLMIVGNNNHMNNTFSSTNTGLNNITNTNGQYLDPTNFNFNFANTSPLYQTGTFNGLVGNYNNVGVGTVGVNKNGGSTELTAGTLTNISVSGTDLYRPNVAIDGTALSTYINLGAIQSSVIIDIFNTFVQTTGTLNRLVQESAGLTVRNQLDYLLQYGNTTAEVDACPQLLMEQGKIITVSGTGGSRLGNCDPNFDTVNYTTPSFQYCIIKLREKTV